MIVNAYLSRERLEDRGGSCPLVVLSSDVAHGGKAVKTAFREVLAKVIDIFASNLSEPEARARYLSLHVRGRDGNRARSGLCAARRRDSFSGARTASRRAWRPIAWLPIGGLWCRTCLHRPGPAAAPIRAPNREPAAGADTAHDQLPLNRSGART